MDHPRSPFVAAHLSVLFHESLPPVLGLLGIAVLVDPDECVYASEVAFVSTLLELGYLESRYSGSVPPEALIGVVWHCVVTECLWDQIRRNKNPTINFKTLRDSVDKRVRSLRPDLFGSE